MTMIDKIGLAATLELLNEECVELAKAAIKLSRDLRGENPTCKDPEDLVRNLHEETADVLLIVEDLCFDGFINSDDVEVWKEMKLNRMWERLKGIRPHGTD